MFTIRNLGGVALFLFGTTYLWLTPQFARPGARGVLWAITLVLSLVTLGGFTAATWGLFTKASWWEQAAIAAGIVGLVTLVPYWIAAHLSGEVTPWYNVAVHAFGAVGVLVLLLVPVLHTWVNGQVMAGA